MYKQKLKQWFLCGLAVLTARLSIAGNYPLIPGVFGALFLAQVNRTILLIFSLFGMVLFLPIHQMVKYAMIVLSIASVVKLSEWLFGNCRTKIGSLICGIVSLLVMFSGELLGIKNRNSIWMGILESIFVVTFIIIASPMIHKFLALGESKKKMQYTESRLCEHGERLQSYAESFHGLAKIFSGEKSGDLHGEVQKEKFEMEEVGRMQQEIISKICISCNQCAICWENNSSPMYEVFFRLLKSMGQLGRTDNKAHQELEACCPYSDMVLEEAVSIFQRARLNLAWYHRLLENREVIAQQLDAMAYIMKDCSKEDKEITKEETRRLLSVKYQLKEIGIRTEEIHLYEKTNQRVSLQISVTSQRGNLISIKEITKAISKGIKKSMIPVKHKKCFIGTEETLLVFEEEPKYQALYGVARLSKDGAQISGDNFSFLDLEEGESILALSDGMGSGIRACKESEMVIELIEKFLEAGFQKETAIRMMNSAMVTQGEDGMYSTVDMASIDLYTGNCEFYKIGSAPGFIKRKENVEMIYSTGLPAGIFHQIDIERHWAKVGNGDFVILLSDGVIDYLQVENPQEILKEFIEKVHFHNPEKIAKFILERVLLFTGGKVPDDMTVLVAGIWER